MTVDVEEETLVDDVIGLIAEIAMHEEEQSKEELSVEIHMKDKMQGYPFLLLM